MLAFKFTQAVALVFPGFLCGSNSSDALNASIANAFHRTRISFGCVADASFAPADKTSRLS